MQREQGVRLTVKMKSVREKSGIKSFSVHAWHLRHSVLELYTATSTKIHGKKKKLPLALKIGSISVLFNSSCSPEITCVKEDCQAAVITKNEIPALTLNFLAFLN